jgi:hypothetical protein
MGAGIFFSIGLCFLFSIPLVTALFAKRMGRRPIVWFFIGAALPGIASIILFLLPDISDNNKN